MGAHSFLAPSSAARRVQCPGSALLEAIYPETEETPESREGTAAHELAEHYIRQLLRDGTLPDLIGQKASNGETWTQAMHDSAIMYAEDVHAVARKTGVFGGGYVQLEEKIHSERIHDLAYGTLDARLWDYGGRQLHLWDYKHGHLVVDAFENWQLIDYAAGLVDKVTNGDSHFEQEITVVFHIVQPRTYHRDGPVRTWAISVGALRAYWNKLADVEREAVSSNPRTITGELCQTCRGRAHCTTLQLDAARAMEVVRSVEPQDLSPDAAATELRLLNHARTVLKARITGLEAEVEGLLRRGEVVPGWRLEQKRGRKRWRADIPVEQVFGTGDMYGVELAKPPEAITPNQAQRLGVDESVINAYAETPITGTALVENDGKKAREVFTHE